VAARRRTSRSARSEERPASKAQREFVSEAEEILDRLRSDLGDLLDQRPGAGDVDPDLVNRIFRSAHTLKGLAGMFGFDGIGDLAHHLEDLLDGLRLGRIDIDAPAVDLIDEVVSLFVSLLEGVGDPDYEACGNGLVADMVARIEASLQTVVESVAGFDDLDVDSSLLRALTEYEEHRLRENLRRGRHICLVDTTLEIIAFEEGLAEVSAAVREVGEVVSTLPSPGETPESQIRFSLLVASEVAAEELSSRLDLRDASVRSVRRGSASQGSGEAAPAQSAAEPTREGGAQTSEEAVPLESPDIESLRSISDTVRVDIRKLDELMNLVGELVIQRNQVGKIADRLRAEPATARIASELAKTHQLLDRKLKDLQTGVLEVRMVPLRQVFEKLSRVVRRLRRDLGKDVQLDFSGADTELDKLIVEQLIDPLMHVVRNAFDHAIEPEDERGRQGKPARGTIRVEGFQRGNHVVIQVSDDGRGIDPVAVREVAEARQIVRPDEVLTQKETLDLIFAPGFSTRSEVSGTSGRGVGMDIVRSNATQLGGVVDIQSDLGRGTMVTLTLPITLAIIQALIVGVEDQRFAIPLNAVLETLLVEASDIQRSEQRELLNLRGEALVLRRLSREFDLQRRGAEPDRHFVVVLGLGELRLGLLVDRLEGQQDTVIKPIAGPIPRIRGIAGATELGDQRAILVLDISSLVEDGVRRREAA